MTATECTGELWPEDGPVLQNGSYRISHPQFGHFSVKVWTAQPESDETFVRPVALLVGPNERTDWKVVARWHDDEHRVCVLDEYASKERGETPINGDHYGERWNRIEKMLAIWTDLALRGAVEERHGHWYGEGYTLERVGHCLMCNRELTDPVSIRIGIGPVCRGKR